MKKIFLLNKDYISKKELFLYILFTYVVVVSIRLIMVTVVCDGTNICEGDYISPLWSYDGGLYGYYAKELLNNNLLPMTSEYIPGYLLYYLTTITNYSLNEVIFYSPAFLSSLGVVPVVIIGYVYNISKFSIIAAIIGNITFSYYSRTHLGYYDTDVLNIVLSMAIVSSLIVYIETKRIVSLFFAILFSIFFYYWYHSSLAIIYSIYAVFLVFIILKNYKIILSNRYLQILLFLFLMVVSYNSEKVYDRALDYAKKDNATLTLNSKGENLQFKSTLSTVDEAQKLDINHIGIYLSYSNYYFYMSLVALIIFYILYPSFIITLPLIGLSILSMKVGIRFAEYGVLAIAFGATYILFILNNTISLFIKSKTILSLTITIMSALLVYQYIKIVETSNKNFKPVFDVLDIKMLTHLDSKLKKGDYILSWWDYGWPLWYYTKADTLIDNGKHHHDNYIISKLLMSDQNYTAKAARNFMQRCQGKGCRLSKKLFKKYDPKTLDQYIDNLGFEQKSTKDIYFVFYERMLQTLPTIASFSEKNLFTNQKEKNFLIKPFLLEKFIDKKSYIAFNGKVKVDLIKATLEAEGKLYPLKEIYIASTKNVQKISTIYQDKANLSVIIYNKKFLFILNNETLNSFFVQVFLLKKHNKELFKYIGYSNDMEVFKLLK